jgi:threonine dehydrogenase-like Zn-dependent dehydrogenase
MLRVAKPAGFGNIVLEEVSIPECGPRDVLVKNQVSLISRGSEVLRRYMHEEAIDPAIMGYSVGGVVAAVGAEAATRFSPGDRVVAVAPHAQYVLLDVDAMEGTAVWPLPDDISFAQAAFLPLVTGGVTWAQVPGIRPGDTVVVLGQGLVGNLVMQAARQHLLARLIVVDTIAARCQLAQRLGADIAINAAEQDPVALVRQLTGGRGAEVVFDCVGGKAGLTSFAKAQEMVGDGGTLHLIGLYHGAPLPLDAGKIQRKRLIGGYYNVETRPVMLARAIELVQAGRIQVDPLISHRFPFTQAKAAYDLLYDRLAEAMGVLLVWE